MSRRKSDPKPGSLVLVTWEDIHEDNEWQDTLTPEPTICACESVGWVSSWGLKHVVLVRTYSGEGDKRVAGDRMTIPRGVIQQVRIIEGAST